MMMNSNHHHASSVCDSMANVLFSPEYNPHTIMNYYSCDVHSGRCSNPHVKNLIKKAKNHISAIGWTFFYVIKKTDQSKKPNLDSFHQMGASRIGGFKKYKRKCDFSSFDNVGSFSCEDMVSLCLDQKSGKDTRVVESEVKNERFSCNRPMK
ncbi:hypothetical protein Tco_0612596 [Tanacetum coccineum]